MLGRKKQDDKELAFDISDFNDKERDEINRIKQMLEVSEMIKTVARQSRIMPGGSLVTPNIIFATNKRLIIRDPNMLGLMAGIESIPYSQINKVHLEKGAFTSELVMDVGQYESGDNEQIIPAIPKKKAAEILSIINEHVRGSQDLSNITQVPKNNDNEDPLVTLKRRLAKGEISPEEYVKLKQILES